MNLYNFSLPKQITNISSRLKLNNLFTAPPPPVVAGQSGSTRADVNPPEDSGNLPPADTIVDIAEEGSKGKVYILSCRQYS